MVNTGNVRLSNVSLTGVDSCTFPEWLLPNKSISCSVVKAAEQADFEQASVLLPVSASASGVGVNTSQASAETSPVVTLWVNRMLSVTLTRQPPVGSNNTAAPVSEAGTVVSLSVTASNPGNVHLRNVTLDVPGLGPLSCVNGADGITPVALPADVLVDSHVVCTGSFEFSQDVLEAGDKTFTASGTAADLADAATSSAVMITVASSPALAVDVDAPNCTKPSRMRKSMTCMHPCGPFLCWPH